MSPVRPAAGRFAPRIRSRKLAGAAFGLACLLATLTGVVVLTVLLASVVAAALRSPAGAPWHAAGSPARELVGFLRHLTGRFGSRVPTKAGFRAGIAGSVWLLALVAAIAIPVGVGAAVFLEEFVPPGRIRRAVQTNIANLAGVPSIVYGILGLTVFARAFGFAPLALGKSLWAGALTLSLLVLPVIVIATQEALRAVPSSLRQAALALGATRWQMVRDHVLPSAVPGILTGTILALSRAIGETAPLLMVGAAASIRWVPAGPSDLYTALPVEIYNYAKEPDPAYATVAAAILIRNRHGRHSRG